MTQKSFLVRDAAFNEVSAVDVLRKHQDFYGGIDEENLSRYSFVLTQDGLPMILSSDTFHFAIPLTNFPEYTVWIPS